MATFDLTADLAAPPADVFAVVADPAAAVRWHPAIVSAGRDAGPVAVGARSDSVFTFYGRPISLAYEVVELIEPSLVVVRAVSRRARATDRFELAPIDGGTHLRYRGEFVLGGFLRVFDRGLQVALDSIGERALVGIEREVTTTTTG